ncbi:MAG: sel1 repeat family protein [bacterium]|nr:sel1 repeat family protein [bacterium]
MHQQLLVFLMILTGGLGLHASPMLNCKSKIIVKVMNLRGAPVQHVNTIAIGGNRAVTDNQGMAFICFESTLPGSPVSFSIDKPNWQVLFPSNSLLISTQYNSNNIQIVVAAKEGEEQEEGYQRMIRSFKELLKKHEESTFGKLHQRFNQHLTDSVLQKLSPHFNQLNRAAAAAQKRDSFALTQIHQILLELQKVPPDSLLSPYDIYWKGLQAYEAGDKSLALKYFYESARKKDANAQYALGHHYSGIEDEGDKDCTQAIAWLNQSLQQKHAKAMILLAVMQHNEICLPSNEDMVYQLLKQAADLGEPSALNNLGIYFRDKKAYETAFIYFERAAIQEYPPAIYNLGWMYKKGKGIKRNRKYGDSLVRKSQEYGYTPGAREF